MRRKISGVLALLVCAVLMISEPAQAMGGGLLGAEYSAAATTAGSSAGSTETVSPGTESSETASQSTESPATEASETQAPALKKVTVNGIAMNISKAVSAKAVIRDSVTVSPVHACTLKLQYYNKGTSKWKTVRSYAVKAGSSGKITVCYTSVWKNSRSSKWRIVVPAVSGYREYVSGTITVTSSRPVKPALKLGSRSAVIIRASDAYVIYGKRKDKKLPNASTTKMMTALLTIERGNLNAVTSISRKAANTGWGCLGASAGTRFRVRDLLTVMLVHSSNDAAAALAEFNAGSVKKFAAKMTARAKQLGCKNTHFVNPHGLNSSRHYSSAYDLAMIQRECIKHPLYLSIIRKRYYSFSTVSSPKTHYSFYTTDALLGSGISGFKGGKTGFTEQAGLCFCGVYKYNGVTYIFTVLGNSSSGGRWSDCRKIMKFIRTNYK